MKITRLWVAVALWLRLVACVRGQALSLLEVGSSMTARPTMATDGYATAAGVIAREGRAYAIEDPRDTAPLGDRVPLILVHGIMLKDGEEPGEPFAGTKLDHFRPLLEGMPQDLRQRSKPYLVVYSTAEGPAVAGAWLASLARRIAALGRGDAPLAFVGYSLGGLVCRYALKEGELGARTAVICTVAAPHHGSFLASLSGVHRGMPELGVGAYVALRVAQQRLPCPPVVREIAYDNHRGDLDPARAARSGLWLNPELASFNAADRFGSRVFAMMGDLSGVRASLAMPHRLPLTIALRNWPERFRTLDPLVDLSSGLGEGLPFAGRMAFPGLDHSSLIRSPRVLAEIFGILRARMPAKPEAGVLESLLRLPLAGIPTVGGVP